MRVSCFRVWMDGVLTQAGGNSRKRVNVDPQKLFPSSHAVSICHLEQHEEAAERRPKASSKDPDRVCTTMLIQGVPPMNSPWHCISATEPHAGQSSVNS